MKTAVCSIGKCENPYIREFVETYKALGFTNIILYDNNVDGGEDFRDVISDYIDEGFVILKDWRNRIHCQEDCYMECYKEYKNDYDWIFFFDCDELLVLPKMTIDEFMSQPKFEGFDMVHFHWMCYGDGDKLRYEDKPLTERIPKQVLPINFTVSYTFPENTHIKSAIRGGMENEPVWTWQPHTPTEPALKCCQVNGEPCQFESPFAPIVFDGAYLRHYTTKTVEEWCRKIERGFPDHTINDVERFDMANKFFRYNKITNSKLKIIEEMLGIKLNKNNIHNIIYR